MRPQQFAEEDGPADEVAGGARKASMRPQQFAEEDRSSYSSYSKLNLASMRPQQFAEEDKIELINLTPHTVLQ